MATAFSHPDGVFDCNLPCKLDIYSINSILRFPFDTLHMKSSFGHEICKLLILRLMKTIDFNSFNKTISLRNLRLIGRHDECCCCQWVLSYETSGLSGSLSTSWRWSYSRHTLCANNNYVLIQHKLMDIVFDRLVKHGVYHKMYHLCGCWCPGTWCQGISNHSNVHYTYLKNYIMLMSHDDFQVFTQSVQVLTEWLWSRISGEEPCHPMIHKDFAQQH